jgi:hypothetical protein
MRWKALGLAGVVGVAATGVLVARGRRQRRAYTPEEIRQRLHSRLAEAAGTDPAPSSPSAPPSDVA